MNALWSRIAASAALAVLAGAAHADIYRCVDASGKTSYSDAPCAKDARETQNITESVGACTTRECEEERRAQTQEARERLRAEKQELEKMSAQRRQAEAEYDRQRAEAAAYRRAVEERLAAIADSGTQAATTPYYGYSGLPVYPIVGAPCRHRCRPVAPTVFLPEKKPAQPGTSLRGLDPKSTTP